MPTLTIKGMPDTLYRLLKERAAAHRRSLNSEILVALEQAVSSPPPDARELLARADALRATLRTPRLTDAQLRAAKNTGRPRRLS
jgi:plasmid stability protein